MKTLIATLALVASSSAFASAQIEKWQGTGASYTPAGVELGTYEMTVTNTELAPGVIASDAVATMADGQQMIVSQKLSFANHGWTVESNLGTGAGACYGDLCENYIAGSGGHAYATTIVKEGARRERQLTTVLENGKAVKMLRTQLVRVQ